jgi:hypothetical protein
MTRALAAPGILAVTAACLVLLWPSAASAKDALVVRACGGSGCVLTFDRASLRRFMRSLDASPAPVAAPRPAPFVRVDVAVGAVGERVEEAWTFYYVPRERLIATNGPSGEVRWYPVGPQAHAALSAVAAGIVPFGAPFQWPREIRRSRDFDANAFGKRAKKVAPRDTTGAVRQTASAAAGDTTGGGVWSNWLILPLAAVAAAGAAAAAHCSR